MNTDQSEQNKIPSDLEFANSKIAKDLKSFSSPGSSTADYRSRASKAEKSHIIPMIFFALILAAASGVLGYQLGKNKSSASLTKTTTTTVSTVDPNQTNTNSQNQASNQGPGIRGNSPVTKTTTTTQNNSNPAKPVVLGTSLVSYNNAQLRFSMEIPGDWQAVLGSNKVTFTASDKNTYSVQVYDVTAPTDLNFIQSQLVQQSNIHNVVLTTFEGQPVLSFNMDGNFQNGYAFVKNGKLYYLLGPGIGSKVENFQML